MRTETGTVPGQAELSDRIAISEVLCSHSRGLDRLDVELLKSCYWPDAEVDYGAYKGSAWQFAEFVLVALGEKYALTRHCLSNTLISVSGERAVAESCVDAAHLSPERQESMVFAGRYLDQLERRDQVWKLCHRQVVMDWHGNQPVIDQSDDPTLSELSRGDHLPDDPLYSLLSQLD